jgi:DNA mismatch repair protein MutL
MTNGLTETPESGPRRIRVLPEHLANKIAAGEVIQRPDSVVKELLENSLDAGAREITVVIREGGTALVQVSDDGVGMDEEDAVVSFLRHATSKIASYEELEAIATYGFRGEALASIAAVARVTLATRRRDRDVAVVVTMDGTGEQRITRDAREPGTTITVQQLFFNTPARRKFLKSTQTEFRHVYDTVQRVALSHPELALRFVSDDDTVFDLRPGTVEDRLRDLFGERLLEGVVRTGEQAGHLSVSGYIAKPQYGQKTRLNQFLFLNRRYIQNRSITHAVYSAYENLMIKGTFPFFLLFLDIDPRRVDVNVHPSKMEAKFEDEQGIYRFVSSLVRKTLAGNDLIPSLSVSPGSGDREGVSLQFTDRQHAPSGAGLADLLLRTPVIPSGLAPAVPPLPDPVPGEGVLPQLAGAPIWQVHAKYILLQIDMGLMVIDQHVAHERILYEQALARFEGGTPVSQQLLFPHTVELTPAEHSLAGELLPYMQQIGFTLQLFGKNTILIDGVPPDLKPGSELTILHDILHLYQEYRRASASEPRDMLAKSYSCKAAIKAGDRLNEQEMRSLVAQLFTTRMPYVCPHGRPIVLKIPVAELDRRFGRTS